MNTNLYSRITEWDNLEFCCGERIAICPNCDALLCVFCQDSCDYCQESVF